MSGLVSAIQEHPRFAIAATVLLVAVGAILIRYSVTGSPIGVANVPWNEQGQPPPAEVQATLDRRIPADSCVAARELEPQLAADLASAGLTSWRIRRGTGVEDTTCVGAATDSEARTVTLLMAVPPDLREKLDAVAEALLAECKSKDQAAALVEAVLSRFELTGWELRQGGRINYPSDRADEVRRHLEAGCWIYSGTGWTDGGVRLFWIGGKQ